MRLRPTLVALLLSLTLGSSAYAKDYVVRSGDTLNQIAARHNTTAATIRAMNGLSGNLILIGQVLKLPDDPTVREHVVVGGDSLNAIASRYGSTVSAIKQANQLMSNLIVVGQRLQVPVVTSTSSSSPATAFAAGSSTSTSSSSGQHWAVRHVPARSASASELEVMARIIKGECPAVTPHEGKVAVAAVILNRVRSSRFPNSIVGVCHQRKQFSCYNPNVRSRLYWGKVPSWAYDVARVALRGRDPTGGSTHYFNPYLVLPSWAKRLQFVRKIENTKNWSMRRFTGHSFYRPKGTPLGITTSVSGTHN